MVGNVTDKAEYTMNNMHFWANVNKKLSDQLLQVLQEKVRGVKITFTTPILKSQSCFVIPHVVYGQGIFGLQEGLQ
jgi:hypothetical protein